MPSANVTLERGNKFNRDKSHIRPIPFVVKWKRNLKQRGGQGDITEAEEAVR